MTDAHPNDPAVASGSAGASSVVSGVDSTGLVEGPAAPSAEDIEMVNANTRAEMSAKAQALKERVLAHNVETLTLKVIGSMLNAGP